MTISALQGASIHIFPFRWLNWCSVEAHKLIIHHVRVSVRDLVV